jgi:hypothetical protein
MLPEAPAVHVGARLSVLACAPNSRRPCFEFFTAVRAGVAGCLGNGSGVGATRFIDGTALDSRGSTRRPAATCPHSLDRSL